MSLDDIVGHERQLAVLRGGLMRGAVAPAYLFYGPLGVGKYTAALEFAKALLCTDGGTDACDGCESCRLAGGGAHPELVMISPEKKVLKIDQIRTVQEFLALTPSRGSRKAAIIVAAETMRREAANAMLKTLEEPPDGAVIILVTSNLGGLLPTVISRCRKVSFGFLDEKQVEEVLRRKGWSDDEARSCATMAEGSPGTVLSLESEVRKRSQVALEGLIRAVAESDKGAVLDFVEGKARDREEAELLLQMLLTRVRRTVRARLGLGSGPGEDEVFGLEQLGEDELHRLAMAMVGTSRFLAGNVNVKLALGSFFSDWIDRLPRSAEEEGAV